MTKVIAKIRDSLFEGPRRIFILYYNAKEAHLFEQADCFESVESDGWIRIWRSVMESSKRKTSCLC